MPNMALIKDGAVGGEMARFWNITKKQEKKAELSIYGDLVDYSWWDDSSSVTASKFKKALDAVGAVDEILVRINSGGGSVFVGHSIYSQLKNHGAKIVCRVEGLAASAASVVAMAADTLIMGNTDYLMIHNPSSIAWGDAAEMRKNADALDVIKDGIVAAYVEKTGKSKEVISALMDAETWMTGDKAVEMGFADETGEEKSLEAVLNDNRLVLNGVSMDMSKYSNFPRSYFDNRVDSKVENKVEAVKTETKIDKEETKVPITNLEELRNECPELVAQVEADAIKNATESERARIREIEEIANSIDPSLVIKAKFETPMSAKDLAFESMKNDAKKGKIYQNNAAVDEANSGMEEVKPSPVEATADDKAKEEVETEAVVVNMAEIANKLKGRTK